MSLKMFSKQIAFGLEPLDDGQSKERVSAIKSKQGMFTLIREVRLPILCLASAGTHVASDIVKPLSIAVADEFPLGVTEGGRRALGQIQKFLQTAAPADLQSLKLHAVDWLNMAAVAATSGRLSEAAAWAQQASRLSQHLAKHSLHDGRSPGHCNGELVFADVAAVYAIAVLFSGAAEVPETTAISLLQTAYRQYMSHGAVLPAVSVLYHMAISEHNVQGSTTALATLELAADLLFQSGLLTEISSFYGGVIGERVRLYAAHGA